MMVLGVMIVINILNVDCVCVCGVEFVFSGENVGLCGFNFDVNVLVSNV